MTKHSLFLLSLLFIITSCHFSKGVKKDLTTGLSSSYNGFAMNDIYLADINGGRLSDNKVSLGDKVIVTATGVDHYEEKEGKVFPGCTIVLTDKNSKEILNLSDAFADLKDGLSPAEATMLKATLNTGEPMIAGETYHLYVRFFDKNKKENEIVTDVDLLAK